MKNFFKKISKYSFWTSFAGAFILFLNALGYEGLAKVSNDDSVYVKYATSVKADLAQNISADFASKITYSDFIIMLYNAFDIKVVEEFMDKVEISRRLGQKIM